MCNRRTTLSGGMHRRSSAAGLSPRTGTEGVPPLYRPVLPQGTPRRHIGRAMTTGVDDCGAARQPTAGRRRSGVLFESPATPVTPDDPAVACSAERSGPRHYGGAVCGQPHFAGQGSPRGGQPGLTGAPAIRSPRHPPSTRRPSCNDRSMPISGHGTRLAATEAVEGGRALGASLRCPNHTAQEAEE